MTHTVLAHMVYGNIPCHDIDRLIAEDAKLVTKGHTGERSERGNEGSDSQSGTTDASGDPAPAITVHFGPGMESQ